MFVNNKFNWKQYSVGYILLVGLCWVMPVTTFAMQASLQQGRVQVLQQYVEHLGKGQVTAITALFAKDAQVVSSSGLTDHPEHFYHTLLTKTIRLPAAGHHGQAHTQLINLFVPQIRADQMVVLFNFRWINQQGQEVSAPFLDLVIFEPGSTKIRQLFVYSNLYKDDIMKQLAGPTVH